MAFNRSSVHVDITAQDKTARAFSAARNNMRALSSDGAKLTRALAGMFGASVGVAVFTRMAGEAIAYGSSLTDAATATNTNVEALQVLRFAAQEAGASQQNLTTALSRVQKSTYDAMNGLSTMTRAFGKLNIDVKTFAQLPTERKMEALAIAASNASDQSEAYGAVLDILGSRNAPRLMEVLKLLAKDGFDGVSESARNAGQVMDEFTAQRLDAAADALERLKTRMKVFNGETAAFWMDVLDGKNAYKEKELRGAGPVATASLDSEKLRGYLATIKKYKAELEGEDNQKYIRFLEKQISLTEEAARKEIERLQAVRDEKKKDAAPTGVLSDQDEKRIQTAMDRAQSATEKLALSKMSLAEKTEYARKKVAELTEEYQKLEEATRATKTPDPEQLVAYYNAKEKLSTEKQTLYSLEQREVALKDKEARGWNAVTSAMEGARDASEQLMLSKMSLAEKIEYTRSKLSALQMQYNALSQTVAKPEHTAEDMVAWYNARREIFAMQLELGQMQNQQKDNQASVFAALDTDKAKSEWEEWRDAGLSAQQMLVNAMKNTSDSMTDSFMRFVKTGEFGFSDFVDSVLEDVARMVFQQSVANPIAQFLSAGISGMFGGGGGASLSSALFGGARATGGSVSASKAYLVGERGPEIFAPGRSGTIIPNHQIEGKPDARPPMVVNFNIQTFDAASFDAGLVQRRKLLVGIMDDAFNRRGRQGALR